MAQNNGFTSELNYIYTETQLSLQVLTGKQSLYEKHFLTVIPWTALWTWHIGQ